MNARLDRPTKLELWRHRCRIGLAVFYGLAGVLHVAVPAPFLTITPAWVPYPSLTIFVTGLCELAGATGLLVPRLRRYAGLGLALYALCVFPANVKHAFDSLGGPDPSIAQWAYHLIRLPLQPVIIWLALFAGGSTTRPLRSK